MKQTPWQLQGFGHDLDTPFTEGEFLQSFPSQKLHYKVCDIVCPNKRQVFSNVNQLATNLQQQLMGKGKVLISYSLAVDESSDTPDTAQLSVFIRGVDSSLCVKRTFGIALNAPRERISFKWYPNVCMKYGCLGINLLAWPKMEHSWFAEKSRLIGRIREKMREENSAGELTVLLHHSPGMIVPWKWNMLWAP